MTPSDTHESFVATAFDGQAAALERAPIHTDPRMLAELVGFADIPAGGRVLDAGCGPGLVAEAFLAHEGNYRVLGCDLSAEMVRRAQARCERFGGRAKFVQGEFGTMPLARGEHDGAVTRLVLHHVADPLEFARAMVAAVRPGGIVVLADHVGDADPVLAEWHRKLELMRDGSHAANLSAGALLDLSADAGLRDLRYEEHTITTDFEEWFSRGTPSATRAECLRLLLSPEGRRSRAWSCAPLPDANASITGLIGLVRGRVAA